MKDASNLIQFYFLKGVNSMKDIPYKIYLTEEEMPRY